MLRSLPLPSGRAMPVLGQGTWGMGEKRGAFDAEVAALKLGLDLGITLIDTAEMYGEGGAEKVRRRGDRGPARRGMPGQQGLSAQCLAARRRRRPASAASSGSRPTTSTSICCTGAARCRSRRRSKRSPRSSRREKSSTTASAISTPTTWRKRPRLPGGGAIATNQVLYNLMNRGIEWDLLPWCRSRGIPVMAYSPFVSAPPALTRLLGNAALKAVAAASWRDPGPDRARLAAAPARRGRDPEGGAAGACPGQPRGLRPRPHARTTLRNSTAPSRHRARKCRWRCCSACTRLARRLRVLHDRPMAHSLTRRASPSSSR